MQSIFNHPLFLNRPFWLAFSLAVSFIVMAPNINNDWVNWDDEAFVQNNPLVTDLSIEQVKEVFTSIDNNDNGGYIPLVILSWSIDYTISGHNSNVFHTTNVLLHLANVWLVFAFIYLLTGRIDISVITAILFGIHPTQLEPVAWVSARKDLLYGLFYLAGLITYIKYIRQDRARTKWLFLLCLLFFVGSILSKAMAVTFPITLIIIDFFEKRKDYLSALLEKLPFLILSVVFGLLAMTGQKQAGAVDDIQNISFVESFFVGCYGLVVYVFKAICPIHLSSYHPYPYAPLQDLPWYLYASSIGAALFVITAFVALRMNRKLAFGMLFFLCSIVLVLQFFPVGIAIVAERYTYLANIGLFFLVASGIVAIATHFKAKRNMVYAAVAVYLTILGTITFKRTDVWENSETLWSDVIKKYPNDFLAYNNRARHYASIGQDDLALQDYSSALQFHQASFQTYTDRGFIYLNRGDFENALSDFSSVISIQKNNADAYTNRGLVLLNMKRYEAAVIDFDRSIELNAENPIAYFNRGLAFGFAGNQNQAISDLTQCLYFDSNYAPAYYWRSVSYSIMKDKTNALKDAKAAMNLNYPINDTYLRSLRFD